VDYGVKKVSIDDHPVSVNFFDLSGNKDYKPIRTEFYTDTSGILMVYDVDNRDSFSALVHWEDEMKRYGVDMARVKVVVAGNKSDVKGREVQPADAQKWCKQRGYTWFETSANTGDKVSESLEYLFKMCLD
jgi:DnaJ family protein C protein 27